MKISDITARKQTFSFEIFPPRSDLPLSEAADLAHGLARFKPDWISVTFSAGGSGNSGNTAQIASEIEPALETAALPHLTCMGASKADIDRYAQDLKDRGIHNILALRGDPVPGREPVDFSYAADLIGHLKDLGFCVGAAAYPEGHIQCPDLETSLEHMKAKQDAGADFFVTQLFFDNDTFYRFRGAYTRARIKVPVIAGIMPFTSTKLLQRMAFTCGASIPAEVIRQLYAAGPEPADQRAAGIAYGCRQMVDLARNGVDGLHIYCMNKLDIAGAAHSALLAAGYAGVGPVDAAEPGVTCAAAVAADVAVAADATRDAARDVAVAADAAATGGPVDGR